MSISFKDLIGREILCKKESCGILCEVCIRDITGKISGIINKKNKFFDAENILKIDKKITLSKKDYNKIIGNNWIGFKVKFRNGKKLGRVNNFWIDENGLRVVKIEVLKSFFGFFTFSKRILPVSKIFEISSKTIIVDSDENDNLNVDFMSQFGNVNL